MNETEEVVVVEISLLGHQRKSMGTHAVKIPLGKDMEEEQGGAVWRAVIMAAREAMHDSASDILSMLYQKAEEDNDG